MDVYKIVNGKTYSERVFAGMVLLGILRMMA